MEASPSTNYKRTHRAFIPALSLVEVIISLVIVSVIFLSLNRLAVDSLKQSKKLELQDQMLSVATEAVEELKVQKNKGWSAITQIFPGNNSFGYLDLTQNGTDRILRQAPSSCRYNATEQYLNQSCEIMLDGVYGSTGSAADAKRVFGRLIVRTNSAANVASFRIVIACIQGRCDPKEYKPIEIETYVYKAEGN
jgi:Tfp pilus assembly protein PilV